MGNQSKPPPPPDTSRFSDRADYQSGMLQNWAQDLWKSGQEEWGRLQNWSQQVMGSALPAMEDLYGWAREQKDFYDQKVVPAMESLFSQAELYSSKGEEQRQRAQAIQDTNQAIEAQRAAAERKLASYGTDPSEVAAKSLDRTASVMQGGMQALASNMAAERTKQIGRDLTAQAVNMGQNVAAQGQGNLRAVPGMGGQALGAATGAGVGGMQIQQGALPYMQASNMANATGAGIVDTSYGRQLDYTQMSNAAEQANFDQMMDIGKGIGSFGGYYKTADGGPVSAPGGPTDDRGAIAISDGEYVIPADVVRKLGTNHFDKMIEKETGRPPPSQKQALPIDGNKMPQEQMPAATGTVPMSRAGVIR